MIPDYLILLAEGRFRVLERLDDLPNFTQTWREAVSETAPALSGAYFERDTDNAGRFPGVIGESGMSTDERLPMKQEEHRRAIRWAVGCIEDFLARRKGSAWAFAAGPGLHNPVLDALPAALRATLAESVDANLVNMPALEAAGHFARAGRER